MTREPCPWCTKNKTKFYGVNYDNPEINVGLVKCLVCGAQGPKITDDTMEEMEVKATAAWNSWVTR